VLLVVVAALPAHDLVVRRRIHPVSLWGGLAQMLSVPIRFALAQSHSWHALANWLIHVTGQGGR
jgi:hypothetical protein